MISDLSKILRYIYHASCIVFYLLGPRFFGTIVNAMIKVKLVRSYEQAEWSAFFRVRLFNTAIL